MASRAKAETGKTAAGERRKLEAELDTALAQTFPASDPFSVGHFTGTEPPSRPIDRKAPELVPELIPEPARKPKASH